MFRLALVQLFYERAQEAPLFLIVGIQASEIVLQIGMTNNEFAFNALYLDGKGLITNDRASNGGELQFNAIMLTPAGIDAVENPTGLDRLVPPTAHPGARNRRPKAHPYRHRGWVFAARSPYRT